MKETGEVIEVKDGIAYLMFNRTSMCAKCGACGMLAGQNNITVTAKNTLEAKKGDSVEVEFTSKNALQSSLIAYILPLIMLFLGVWIGYMIPQQIMPTDVMAAIFGIVLVALAFVVLRLLNPVFKKKFAYVYSMVRINNMLKN